MRTVSTAYRGTPSARCRICSRSSSGNPGTSPSSNCSIAGACSGSRNIEVKLRLPAPQEVFNEVEQRGVGPLHVLEEEHHGRGCRQPLEEEPPRAEEILTFLGCVIFETQQLCKGRLDPAPLFGVRDVLREAGLQLRARRHRVLTFGDARTHA